MPPLQKQRGHYYWELLLVFILILAEVEKADVEFLVVLIIKIRKLSFCAIHVGSLTLLLYLGFKLCHECGIALNHLAHVILALADSLAVIREPRTTLFNDTALNSVIQNACFLGNTLTTDAKATGTQALGTVHKQEEDEIKDEDQALILSVLNSAHMRKILASLGYNVEGGEFRFIEVKDIDKTVQLQVVTQMMDRGLPIDDDYLYDTFDIDKPANYDQMKAEAQKKADEKAAQQQAVMQELQKQGKSNPKNEAEVSFWNKVKGFFSEAPQDGAGFPF